MIWFHLPPLCFQGYKVCTFAGRYDARTWLSRRLSEATDFTTRVKGPVSTWILVAAGLKSKREESPVSEYRRCDAGWSKWSEEIAVVHGKNNRGDSWSRWRNTHRQGENSAWRDVRFRDCIRWKCHHLKRLKLSWTNWSSQLRSKACNEAFRRWSRY